jgi:hypothetical protein
MITWLPVDRRVKEGAVISLDKNPRDRWKVVEVFSPMDSQSIQRGWGLDLAKSIRTEV